MERVTSFTTPFSTTVVPASDRAGRSLTTQDRALLQLGQALRGRGYRFTTPTPLTHRRVIARQANRPCSLADVFGWSRTFLASDVDAGLLGLLREAQALEAAGSGFRCQVRFSTLGDQLFAHSAFPTEGADAVFFGPDTYRFARAIGQLATRLKARAGMRVLDVGAGSGAGGLHAAASLRHVSPQITLTDINEHALRFCRINAALNDVEPVDIMESDLYANVSGRFDLIVANPPYLVDPLARLYRHGGGALGAALSERIAIQGIERLAPGGSLLLYTGSAIVDGVDALHETLRERLSGHAVRFSYEEIDPDVFGEELESAPYDAADRIAVVAAIIEAM